MSKYQTTMYNRFNRVKRSLESYYSTTLICEPTFEKMLDSKTDYRERVRHDKDRLNMYYLGKISGIDDTLFHNIQRNKVIWKHYLYTIKGDIIFYDKWERIPEDCAKVGLFCSGHFWKESLKPFDNITPQNCFNTLSCLPKGNECLHLFTIKRKIK